MAPTENARATKNISERSAEFGSIREVKFEPIQLESRKGPFISGTPLIHDKSCPDKMIRALSVQETVKDMN
jgi:hypothetical protein